MPRFGNISSDLDVTFSIDRYNTEATTNSSLASTAAVIVEKYLTVQADGHGFITNQQSDTPSTNNKIVRKIWYKANSFEASDVTTWTLVNVFADNTSYNNTETYFNDLLKTTTYGTPPLTLAQSWEEAAVFTGLLDDYPGAAAAYSLRLLDADYTGSAINVRRASDNAVQDIGFDANGDLDTSALATFCSGTDGYVVRYYDQSGNGYDAVQATTSLQDQIVSSGAVLLENGKPATIPQGFGGHVITGLTGSSTTHVFEVVNVNQSPAISLDSANTQNQYPYLAWNGSTANAGNGSSIYANGVAQSWVTRDDVWQALNNAQKVISYKLDTSNFSDFELRYGVNNTAYAPKRQETIIYFSDQSSNRIGIEADINARYNMYWDGSQPALLDSYPLASAAYSLRALNSDYVGPLIRVRRASDSAEQDISALYDGSLNVGALATFCAGTDGFVVRWYDQSSNGIDLTQNTTAYQPKIVQSGSVITRNAKPVVRGVNGNTALVSGTKNLSDFFSASGHSTIQALYSSQDEFNIKGALGGANWINCIANNGTSNSFVYLDSGNLLSGGRISGNVGTVSHQIAAHIRSNNSGLVYRNGSQVLSGTFTDSPDAEATVVTMKFKNTALEIHELIHYPSDQSANRAGIESNINDYYTIY